MVKTPRTRHYKSKRAPVTLDLQAESDSTVRDAAKDAVDEAADPGRFEPWVTSDDVAQETAEAVEADDAAREASSPTERDGSKTDQQREDTVADADSFQFGRDDARAEADATPDRAVDYGLDERIDAAKPDDEPEPYVAPGSIPPASAVGGRSRLSNLAAGLIGGVSALVLAGLLQFAGLLGAPGGGSAAPALDPVLAEIAALKSEIETLKAAPADGADGSAVAGLTGTVDQLKADVAKLQSALAAGEGGDGAAVAGLDAKVKELEAALGKLGQAGQGAPQEAMDAVTAKVGAMEQSIAALTSKTDAQAAQPKIALAISASALKSALDRGSAFSAELETFAAISPNAPEIEPLRQYAEAGVMTRADIAKAFPDAANAMIAAAAPVEPDAGFLQRLLSSAESVVKVRPIGDVSGEDPPARIARMEVAVTAGDYDKALAEFAALPEPVQTAGAALADKIKARVEVEKLVDQMIAGAMKAA